MVSVHRGDHRALRPGLPPRASFSPPSDRTGRTARRNRLRFRPALSILDDRVVPAGLFAGQSPGLTGTDQPYELGTRFTPAVNGTITDIAYFKPTAETGAHTGTLWDSYGTVLESVAFTAETAAGWQDAVLAAPIPVTAGQTYTASVNSNAAYADSYDQFDTSYSAGQLTVPASGGVFNFTPGSFPTSVYRNSNYFRDVGFTPSPPPPPVATNAAYELGTRFSVSTPGVVTGVSYDEPAQESGGHTGTLWDANGIPLATVTFTGEQPGGGWQTALFSTPVALTPGEMYTVSVNNNTAYTFIAGAFNSPSTVGPISYPIGAGVYATPGAFPQSTYNNAGYDRTPVFVAVAPLSLSPLPDQYVTAGSPVSVQAQATGPNNPITYSATGLPDGLTVNTGTGVISGALTPAAAAAATQYAVMVQAADPTGAKVQQPLNINVFAVKPISDLATAEAYTLPMTGGVRLQNADPTKPVTYSAAGLPAGVVLDPSSGVVSGQINYTDAQPGQTNVHVVMITAVNGTLSASTQFNWAVTDVNPLSVLKDLTNYVNDPASVPFTIANINLLPGAAFTVTGLPAGVGPASGTVPAGGSGDLMVTESGTLTTPTPAANLVTVSLTSGGQLIGTRTFYWNVLAPNGPSITGPAVVPGNSIYSYAIHFGQIVDISTTSLDFVVTPVLSTVPVTGLDATAAVVNGETVETIREQFANTAPAKLLFEARVNGTVVASLPIVLVQIIVSNPDTTGSVLPFTPGIKPGTSLPNSRGMYKKKPTDTSGLYGLEIDSGVHPGSPGISWRAKVTAVGPDGGQGLSSIQFGFIQHATLSPWQAVYADGTRLTAMYNGAPLSGTYLDKLPDSTWPWYNGSGVGTYAVSGTIGTGEDTPGTVFPLSSDMVQLVNGVPVPVIPDTKYLKQTIANTSFVLDVAVATLDTSLGANTMYYSEAYANWSFDAGGGIDPTTKLWSGGSVTTPTTWTVRTSPLRLDTDPGKPIGSQVIKQVTWAPSQG